MSQLGISIHLCHETQYETPSPLSMLTISIEREASSENDYATRSRGAGGR